MQLIESTVINPKELQAYNHIRTQFSGLTLQEAYNAINAVRDYLGILGDNVEDANAFVFN